MSKTYYFTSENIVFVFYGEFSLNIKIIYKYMIFMTMECLFHEKIYYFV